MTAYPGNPSLSPEIRERVLTTFGQTLELFKQGNVEQTVSGCDFLLQLDPTFEPARKLRAKATDPFADVDVESLIPHEDHSEDLAEARKALRTRDFQRAADLCTTILASDFSSTEAQAIAQEAEEKLEAQPFVLQFLQKCRSQIDTGNIEAARATIAKARTLDPDHPLIAECEALISGNAPTPQPPAAATTVATDSFVVDTPTGTEQSGTPASDFGFTFEEDSRGSGFSFEPPSKGGFDSFSPPDVTTPPGSDAVVEVGEAQTFDFSMASVETSPEDQNKIEGYLSEGDRLLEKGDYQSAIDAWSKVFLIDVTNDAASERIESAKKTRQQTDNRIEDLLVAASFAMDRGDGDGARTSLQEALDIDPSNPRALEQMNLLGKDNPQPATPTPPSRSGSASAAVDDLMDDFSSSSADAFPSAGPSSVPDEEEDEDKVVARPTSSTKPRSASRKPVAAIVAAVLVVLALGWFAWIKIFGVGSEIDEAMTQTMINQAITLGGKGQYDQAIALLIAIKPEDPMHDRSLEMIADLKKKKSDAASMVGGRPANVVFSELVEQGRQAFATRDFLAAKSAFESASAIHALPADLKPLLETSTQEVAKFDAARIRLNTSDFAGAIAVLQPLYAEDPSSVNVRQLLAASHFNLGVLALRGQRDKEAQEEFAAVLEIDPNDDLARRSREIAARYETATKDLLYHIYVNHLPMRMTGVPSGR